MAIENFNEITEYFNTNKDSEDVKNFMGSLINVDNVKNFLETNEDGKKYINSYADTKVTKAINTWKTNNLQNEVDKKVKELYPDKDPKDIQIQELKKQFEDMQKEATRKDLTNTALQLAQEKKLPTDLINFFIGQDEETTKNNLLALERSLEGYTQKTKEEILKSGAYTPPKAGNPITTQEQVQAEVNKYFGL